MARTVSAAFDQFYDAINLSGDHRDTANSRRTHITEVLSKSLNVRESFASGSIPRFTALSGYSDLDIIVALHYGNHIQNKKPSEVLQTVRDALGEYKTNVRKNGQAVTLYYQTWPNVDIVPASQVTDSQGVVTHYNIPDMNTEQWIASRPKAHATNIDARAAACGPLFRKIIKMAKWWNKKHSDYMQSYHLEAMAVQMFGTNLDDLPWNMFSFFNSAASLAQGLLWYEGAYVDSYLTYSHRQEVVKRLESARDVSRAAWAATYGKSDHETAITKWRQVFGDAFPSFG
jgi:hypothetical protein